MSTSKNEGFLEKCDFTGSLPVAVIQDSFKIYFQEIEKGIFEMLAQNGFH